MRLVLRALAVNYVLLSFAAIGVPRVGAAPPAHLWSQRFGDAGDQVAHSVAVDASGEVIVTGYFQGTVNFGGSNLTSVGGADIFVAKFNSAGVHQWSQSFGDANYYQYGTSVAVDASGSVIVTGQFQGTINFGGSNLTSAGSYDIFVARFNSAGVHQWSQRFGDGSDQVARSVAVDDTGNVIMVGSIGSNLTTGGVGDILVTKLNSAGVVQWSRRFGGGSDQVGMSVAVDASGNVLVTGFFQGTVNFGGSNLTSAGSYDIFVAKFNPAGIHQWSQRFGAGSDQVAMSVAVDASGNVIVAGDFEGTVNFGGSNLTGAGGADIFVSKFDSAGAHQWSQRFGAAGDQILYSVAADASGNVIVTGFFCGTVNFGGANLTEAGPADIFVAKFSAAGIHEWSQGFGDASDQIAYSVAADASGNMIVAGYFEGTVNFGGASLASAGLDDIFIAKFGGTLSGVDGTPRSHVLSVSAYPNPFNPTTTIRYTLPSKGRVTVAVYDGRGARVATLLDHEEPAGAYTVLWEARSDGRGVVSSGVYFARIEFNGETRACKLVLLK